MNKAEEKHNPSPMEIWASYGCACVHPDGYECMVLRSAGSFRTREDAEEDARMYGGCECGCHDRYDDFDEEWA